jgi:hypothetical protein
MGKGVNETADLLTHRVVREGRMAKAKLGSGARFKALKKKVGSGALAAYIGRKKYGKKKFAKLSAKGRRRKSS